MLTFWCFIIAGAATVLTGHSPLAGLVAGLAAAAARHVLPRAAGLASERRRSPRNSAPSPAGRPVGGMRKWRSIPMVGRVIIIAIAVLVFAVAGVACTTSYNAIYRLVGMLGLYGKSINQVFPLMLDVAFIGCELAAIVGTILRALHVRRLSFPAGMDPDDVDDAIREARRQVSRGWPVWTMLTCGVATIAFNVAHAYLLTTPAQSPAPGLTAVNGTALVVWRCVVASFPPLVMILFFQVLIAIVKWTMVTTGRPLDTGAALSPAGWAPQFAPHAYPPPVLAASPQTVAAPSFHENGHNGQAGTVNGQSKRQWVEGYLEPLGPQELKALTARQVAKDLTERGYPVTERTVIPVLKARRARG
jgi:hypothetical protein